MAKGQRDPKREEFWRGVLKRFADSGLSARAFCRNEQLGEASFYAWRRTIGQRDAGMNQASRRRHAGEVNPVGARRRLRRSPAFRPVAIESAILGGAGHGIRLELRGGHVLRFPVSIETERLVALIQRVKILWWDRDGLAIFYKRLERNEFHFPVGDEKSIAIERSQLMRLLSGLELAAKHIA